MVPQDLTHHVKVELALKTDATTGATIDTLGFNGLAFAIVVDTLSDSADIALPVEESVDGTNWTTVASDDLHGESVVLNDAYKAANGADSGAQLGYIGSKRYVRLRKAVTAGTANVTATAVLGHPELVPTY
ncbi:MAG: hypothetical protein AAGI08_00200 [Bacteroidota bacterium]